MALAGKLLLALLLTLVVAAVALVAGGLLANRLPWNDAPGTWRRLATYLSSNVAETSEAPVFPELRSRVYRNKPAILFQAVGSAAQTLGWEIASRNLEDGEIELVITSKVWRFKDDVRVRIVQRDTESAVHIRSSSRIGRADLGANTRHVLDLYEQLEAELE